MHMININPDFFNLSKTLECGQCFHYQKISENRYLVYGYNTVCIAEQKNDKLFIESDNLQYWKKYFALDIDYEDIVNYLKDFAEKNNDTFALKAINEGQGIRILRQPFFEAACSYILSQQNNIPRIRKMIFDLSTKYSSKKIYFNDENLFCFPTHCDLLKYSERDFVELGFGYRAKYLEDFIKNWNNVFDKIKFQYDKDFKTFLSCKGIGEKVANCICLYALEEYDAFPIDVWMKKIIKEEYTDKNKELKIPDKYAGILQQFMFYYKRTQK